MLVDTGRNSTGTESTKEGSVENRQKKEDELRRYNSLLDPRLGIYDLDTMVIDPAIFKD